ncbi:MAG: TldD/PmbA family protein [Desulfurococcaceae archaeon]
MMARASAAAETLLKRLGKSFDEAAVLVLGIRRTMVKFANRQPSVVQSWDDLHLQIYVARGGRILLTSLSAREIDEASRAIEGLSSEIDRLAASSLYAPLPQPSATGGLEGLADHRISEAIENPEEVAEMAESYARGSGLDDFAGTLDLARTAKCLAMTTSTKTLCEEGTSLEFYVRFLKEPDGSGQWGLARRKLDEEGIRKTIEIAAGLARESAGRSSVPEGKYDVVLSPLVFAHLMGVLARMASAYSVMSGTSVFVDKKIGEGVASEKLTIVDSPRLSELPLSSGFDDEGQATYDKSLIERGILRSLLHNTKTAAKMGANSTANAGWIQPRPWNLVIEAGDAELDEMLSLVRRGLLITNNWYTRIHNAPEGSFSTITRDAIFVIEGGKIVRPAEKVRISDNLLRIASNLELLSRERYDIHWWDMPLPSRAPYALIRDVRITKPYA